MSRSRRARALAGLPLRLRPRSFRGKIVAWTLALTTVGMVVVVLGIQLLLAYTTQRDITQVIDSRADAVVTTIQLASTRRLTVPSAELDPGVVVYDGEGRFVAGSIELKARDAAADLSRVRQAQFKSGPDGEERLLGRPFSTPSGARGVIVVSQETAPYERSEFYALIATCALATLVIAGTAVIALRVTRKALAPVSQMAQRAAEWSEHDLSHRFGLGPPTHELAALGETLDHLLDRVASAILSEQRLTSELAHELRTPLTAILGSADLALMRGVGDVHTRTDLEEIATSAREMSTVISTLLSVAREQSAGGQGQSCSATEVVEGLLGTVPDRVPVQVRTEGSVARIAAPASLVIRAVSPVLENAVRHARSGITIEARDSPGRVELTIVDDGPGIAPQVRASLFEPGVTSGTAGGSGLGLGIARRVARSFGGDISVGAETTGASFVLRLPRC